MDDRRVVGIAAALVALGPIVFFAIFATWSASGLSPSEAADPTIALPFLRSNGSLIVAPTLNSIVMHVAVVVLAIGLWTALHTRAPLLAATGAVFGILWGLADIAQSLVLYNAVLSRPASDPATVDVITKGLQNTAHLGGGLWTLVVVATSAAVFGRAHRAFGVVAGSVFVLHPLIVPVAAQWFYLEYVLLPLWFAWTGVAILRSASTVLQPRSTQAA